ncbi:MAG: hypothetical protein Q8P18_30230 [Pseudomonadota bacterium]|nr:hypothetical protein [Pseudomonadota bacterium]
MLEVFRRMWIGWNVAVRRIMGAQSAVLMGFTWLVGLAPVAVALRLGGRRLLDRAPADPTAASHRLARDPSPIDMEKASRMF